MARKFLGDIPSAPASNKLRIAKPSSRVKIVKYGNPASFHADAEIIDSFSRKTQLARLFNDIKLDVSKVVPEDILEWSNLSAVANNQLEVGVLRKLPQSMPKSDQKEILKAAFEGMNTITATLEVVPKVIAREGPTTHNLHEHGIKSLGVITTWATIHDMVDRQLAYALAEPKPLEVSKVFDELHFEPTKFMLHSSGAVVLNPDIYDALEGADGKHPVTQMSGSGAMFGCPAKKIIPSLYLTMNDLAEESGLYERTYKQAKENITNSDVM